MTRMARSPYALALFLLILVGAPLWYASCARTNTALGATASPLPMTPLQQSPAVELEDAMLMAGLDPKALTAVGLSAQGLAAFVDDFRTAHASHGPALIQAEANIATARVSSDALRRKIQSGKGDSEDVTAYQAAVQALETAQAAKQTALSSCRGPAEGALNQTQRDQLARIRTNKHWELPTEFLLVDRTEVQWVALRDALANEKIAPRYGEEVAPQHASVLSTARAHADVALAKSRLDSNLAAVQAAMQTALVE